MIGLVLDMNAVDAVNAVSPLILVCGSRDFANRPLVVEVVDSFDPASIVITGGARGVDKWAALAASSNGLHNAIVPALWSRYGRSAGPKRNAAMLRLRPDIVVAFWDGKSRGTRGMIDLARQYLYPVTIYAEDGSSRILA